MKKAPTNDETRMNSGAANRRAEAALCLGDETATGAAGGGDSISKTLTIILRPRWQWPETPLMK